MHTIIVVLHMFVCIGLIGLILIQHGKGADAGAAFGSGASATVFGSRGSASFLTRTTAILATTFFITSLTLAYFSEQQHAKSVIEDKGAVEIPTAPAEKTPPVNEPKPTDGSSGLPPLEEPVAPKPEAAPPQVSQPAKPPEVKVPDSQVPPVKPSENTGEPPAAPKEQK